METETLKQRLWFPVYAAVGCFGAIGQAMWLRNDLVNSYPFKMMSVPPAEFYSHIGQVGAIISPVIAIAAIFLFISTQRYWIPAVPVVVCPLIFWLVFECFSWWSPYHGALMVQQQFEGYTGESAGQLFRRTSLMLSGAGLLIGFVAGVILSLVEDLSHRPSSGEGLR